MGQKELERIEKEVEQEVKEDISTGHIHIDFTPEAYNPPEGGKTDGLVKFLTKERLPYRLKFLKRKVAILGNEHEWKEHFPKAFLVSREEELQAEIVDGKLKLVYGDQEFYPDLVLYRAPYTDELKPLLETFMASGVRVVNNPQAIVDCFDELNMMETMGKAGVKIPKTYTLKDYKLPLVVKVQGLHRGQGKFLARTEKELKQAIEKASKLGEFYFQEFLEGVKEYRVLVINGYPVSTARRFSEDWKKNVGASGEVVAIRVPELDEIACQACEALNLEIGGVDIIETKDGFYAIEVNSEPDFRFFGVRPFQAVREFVEFRLDQEEC